MDKKNLTIARTNLLTTVAFGGVAFVYGLESPLIAAGISFVSLAMNCVLCQRVGYFS